MRVKWRSVPQRMGEVTAGPGTSLHSPKGTSWPCSNNLILLIGLALWGPSCTEEAHCSELVKIGTIEEVWKAYVIIIKTIMHFSPLDTRWTCRLPCEDDCEGGEEVILLPPQSAAQLDEGGIPSTPGHGSRQGTHPNPFLFFFFF